MNKLLFVFLLLNAALTGAAQSVQSTQSAQPIQPPYWQQAVNYTIDVTLDDASRSLDGFIKINYTNNSPDTLHYIWIHCWPNAFKNDRTAFSEQLLNNGRTDFYFSDKEQKGYINRLEFRVDSLSAKMEDHPQYIDIIKVILPRALPPNSQTTLSTPFHVKLPYNFSRGGYRNVAPMGSSSTIARQRDASMSDLRAQTSGLSDAYQITQWYPKPAVYDSKGWHPIPYLDQGEFYSEFGSFDVHITLPSNYTVAATGELQDAPGLQEIAPAKTTSSRNQNTPTKPTSSRTTPRPPHSGSTKPAPQRRQPTSIQTKTLHYKQANVHDFAWFADKTFKTDHDTITLNGKTIQIYSYYTPTAPKSWANSTKYIKAAIKFHSEKIGKYPYNVVTAVETTTGEPGGMEYPTITAINEPNDNAKELDLTIEHEVGHNWFYGVIGTNERRHPWMDEGINTYYDKRYESLRYAPAESTDWLQKKLPADQAQWGLDITTRVRKDQPISTASEDFSETNYYLTAYTKAGAWMKLLEDSLGVNLFDSCMQTYFRRWSFKHPYPEDLQQVIDETAHRNTTPVFALLDQKGPLKTPTRKTLKPTFLFNFRNTDQFNYISFGPAVTFNKYDKFMVGAFIHNYNLPPNPFQFFVVPLYATGSHQLNGGGKIGYSWYPDRAFRKIDLNIGGERFSSLSGIDSNGQKITGGYYKIVPTLRFTFPNNDPRSRQETAVEWKTYLIGEKPLDKYVQKSTDSLYYPVEGKYNFRYLNQLSLDIHDDRVLYPYKARLQVQQAAAFYRIDLTTNYFFNYEKGGGLEVRLFGSKFGYLGERRTTDDLSRFQPKLTAVRGVEDYTYSNYFIGRNEFTGGASQQIMLRDGDLKLRTDLFQDLQGRSDNWVAALNLTSTLPRQIVPEWLPVKVFFDLGTYSQAWQNNPPTSHFLYVGGLQLSLLENVVRVYLPLVYSKDFSNQLKTVPDQNGFWKKISFSIDLQNINFRKLFGNIPL